MKLFLKNLSVLILGSISMQAQIGSPTTINITPLSVASTTSSDTATQPADTNILYTVGTSCEAIAWVNSSSDLGFVESDVTVNATATTYLGEPYVRRNYNIASTLSDTTMVNITLFFSDADFADYNASLGGSGALPIDATASNLLITAFEGGPSDGTTGPGGAYDSTNKMVIVPTVTYNSTLGYYEVSFSVPASYNGFFAHTNPDGAPLPLRLKDIYVQHIDNYNLLTWTTLIEENGDYFEVEKSENGSDFRMVKKIMSNGMNLSNYTWIDNEPHDDITFYRLKLVANSTESFYSKVVFIRLSDIENNKFTAHPNPFEDRLFISIENNNLHKNAQLQLFTIEGKLITTIPVTYQGEFTIESSNFSAGTYLLKFINGQQTKTIKLLKSN